MKRCFLVPIVCVVLAAICILVGGRSSSNKQLDPCQSAEEMYQAYLIATESGMLTVSKEQAAQAKLAAFVLSHRCGWSFQLWHEDVNGVPQVTKP